MKHYILIFITLLIWQCKPEKTREGILKLPFRIGETYPSVADSEYELSYRLIPLETQDESLVGKIHSIKKYKGFLYVCSFFEKSVLIFTDQGKFIKKFAQGRGPGELIRPEYIIIDEANDQLEILDFTNQIKRYTLEGDYIGNKPCKMASCFEKINGNYIFQLIGGEYKIEIVNTSDEGKLYIPRSYMNLEGRSIYSDLFKADTTIYYHLNNYNQIYTISANNLTPQLYAVIPEQASNDRIPAEEVVLPEDRLAYCKKNNLYEDVMNFNVLHNGHTIYAEMYTSQNMDLLLYNIDNGKTYRIDDGLPQRIFGNDRNTQYKFLTVSSLPELMQDEKIKNNKYLYDQISEIASFVKEDDNPIVVEIEIKKKA